MWFLHGWWAVRSQLLDRCFAMPEKLPSSSARNLGLREASEPLKGLPEPLEGPPNLRLGEQPVLMGGSRQF
jgi:hypothetical protein